MVCSDFGIKILIAWFIKKPSVVPGLDHGVFGADFQRLLQTGADFRIAQTAAATWKDSPTPLTLYRTAPMRAQLAKKKNN